MQSKEQRYVIKGDQGDVRFVKVAKSLMLPSAVPTQPLRRDELAHAPNIVPGHQYYAAAHSESGHHHTVDATQAILHETSNPFIAYLVPADEYLSDIEVVHQKSGEDTHGTVRLAYPGPDHVWGVLRQTEWFPEGLRSAAD